MARSVTISSGLISVRGRPRPAPHGDGASRHPLRSVGIMLAMTVAFAGVGAQLVRLAAKGGGMPEIAISAPVATAYSRPDLVDRNGRLLASDVELPSLYADPLLMVDRDEVVEKLRVILPDIDDEALRQTLKDRNRRFEWIKRGLSPATAQRIHNLGLPGLAFRQELRRAYPSGRLAGHVLGGVNVDNRAVGGIEQHLDEKGLVDPVVAASQTSRPAVALSIDMSVQHALERELATAIHVYRAQGAGGLILDVETGEVLASASLPLVDPAHPDQSSRAAELDRISAGTYELGSIFKLVTIAQALEHGHVSPSSILDVTKPLKIGRSEIKDHHPQARPLSVRDVFLKSSNVGAAMLALDEGVGRQKEFLASLGLTKRLRTEAGPLAAPQLPDHWAEVETATVAFGHGIAVTPLQFAAAAAALVNGGKLIEPTLLKRTSAAKVETTRVVSEEVSAELRRMMRANVEEKGGTGSKAAVPGYAIGGKTGTAEIAVRGRYDRNAVIASFLAAFPIDKPRYVSLVLIVKPSRTAASSGEITASHTAAPVMRRLITRVGPLLGLRPDVASAKS